MSLIQNKKFNLNYSALQKYDAGIKLSGQEVKSLRSGQGSIEGALVIVRGGEAFLVGSHIPAYQPKNAPATYEAERSRKLLLSKKEITELAEAESKKGLTVVPISVYNSARGKLKVSLAVARGKKKYDKREDIKKREVERDIRRTLK